MPEERKVVSKLTMSTVQCLGYFVGDTNEDMFLEILALE